MTPGDLHAAFRSSMGDEVLPHLWTDAEVGEYLNDAYFMFARLTGGIADFGSPDSPWCSADVFAGEPVSALHPSLLRITSAQLRSTGRPLEIVNYTNLMTRGYDDYGERLPARLDDTRGPVRTMVIGMRPNTARWVAVPEADDVVDLVVWGSRRLNALADDGNFRAITLHINGGTNGIEDRLALYEAAKKVLNVTT